MEIALNKGEITYRDEMADRQFSNILNSEQQHNNCWGISLPLHFPYNLSIKKQIHHITRSLIFLIIALTFLLISNKGWAQTNTGWLSPSTNPYNNSVTNPTNVYTSDNARATFNSTDDIADYGGFSITIPTGSTITGIEVGIEGYNSNNRQLEAVSLSWNNGTNFTTAKSISNFPTGVNNEDYRTLGSSSDDWGRTWTTAELANTNFRVRLDATYSNGNLFIDHVRVNVYYLPLPGSTITQTFTSSGSFTVPNCVTSLTVEAWGGGGGGAGDASSGGYGNGGGGGGAYAKVNTITVTPGGSYTITIGTGGAGGASNSQPGTDGGSSSFSYSSNNICVADGGKGGAVNNNGGAGGAGGSSTNSDGDVKYSGGNGYQGGTFNGGSGGGGGGSAGSASNGNSGNNQNGGNAVTGGGAGGNGDANSFGFPGSSPGGGGGGGEYSGSNFPGGAGANGQIRITYTLPSAPTITLTNISVTTDYSASAQNVTFAYSASTGCPNLYSIDIDGDPFITDATLSASPITITLPAGLAVGTYNATLTVKNSTYGFVSSGYSITVIVGTAAPTITSFTPSSVCVGNTVTITGTNFTGATSVKFNGVEATSFTVVDATSITAIPASATTGVISVTKPGGTATSSSSITVYSPSGNETTSGAGSWIGYAYESSVAGGFSKYIGYVTENEIFNRDFDNSCGGQVCGVTSDLCSTPANLFAIRYKMNTTFPAGSYTFTIGGDDGVRLYVNGNLLINDWDDHGYRERTGTICLNGNTNLILEHYENGGSARVSFNYSYISSPTTTGVTICQGGNGSLTASVCPTGTLDWYTASSGGTKIGSGSPFNPVGISGSGLPNTNTAGTTTFYAECSASPGCRTATSFLINTNPTVNAGSPVVAILQGGTTAALGGSFGGSATAAIWSDGGAGGSFSNNGGTTPGTATYTASSSSASPVTLTLTTSGGLCGTTSASKQLTVSSNLTASISINYASDYCTADGSATVTPTGGSGSYSYAWSPSGESSATANDLAVGEYTVTVTDDVSLNSQTYTVNITTAYGAGCATAGKDGDATISSAPNSYYTAISSIVNAGATEIELSSATSLSAGDLLLVIQMQGADMDITNTSSYGATSNVTAGVYEYVAIESVNSSYAYLKTPLVNTYENINSTTTTGRKRFQIIKVPQYNNLTLTGNITVSAWNGTSGGIFAVDVAGTLNMDGNTISANGAGFRGGAGVNSGTAGGTPNFINDYVFPIGTAGQGYKGEGIAGTPASVYNGSAIVSTGSNYQTGDKGKGAPGNAGGGANDAVADNGQNSGGGGGANISPGGSGGRTWNSNLANGGFGGKSFTGSENAVILGGGGGAGTINATNPLPHGGVGGGIVIIHAGTISNAGTITANGTNAPNTLNEGAGGGGAGGSIIISAASGLNNITTTANGGKGGDAWPLETPGGSPGQRHGPGGGGSGGAIYSTGTLASFSILAGANGITTTANDAYGSTSGSTGSSSTVSDNDLSTTILGRNCPVLDNTAPTITCPSDVMVCEGNVPDAFTTIDQFTTAGGTASDAGSGLSCITYTETVSEASGTITREYTIYDKTGNYSSCTQTITVSTPSVSITSDFDDSCPQLITNQGFKPENDNYDAGSTKITFEVSLSGTSATTLSFKYKITGTNVSVRTNLPLLTPPFNGNTGDISGTNPVELTFYIDNNPPIELYPKLEITNITDGNGCAADDPTPLSVTINAMPEVGKYE